MQTLEQQTAHTPSASTNLPEGYEIERDQDGDWWLFPPDDVTIFFVPGEGWLVDDYYMQGRDWDNLNDIKAACLDYIAATGAA